MKGKEEEVENFAVKEEGEGGDGKGSIYNGTACGL